MTHMSAAGFSRFIADIKAGGFPAGQDYQEAFSAIMDEAVSPPLIKDFLLALAEREISVDALVAAAQALRQRALCVTAPPLAIDTCGTGGDGLSTLNVSTATALVVAACGLSVAKHGNRSATSKSSSAAVLEELGVAVELPPVAIEQCLNSVGIAFMLANVFHPAMKVVAHIRRELGIPTIFNLIGPLVNPANVQRQIIGVYSERLLEPMAQALMQLGIERAWVVHGAGGMDELSLAGASSIIEVYQGSLSTFQIHPSEIGISPAPVEAIKGADASFNAAALRRLLAGERGAYRDTVILNTAAALVVGDKAPSLQDGATQAARALDNGSGADLLGHWVKTSKGLMV